MNEKDRKFKEKIDEILENEREYGGVLDAETKDLKKKSRGKPLSAQQLVYLVERFFNRGLDLDFDRKGDLERQIKLLIAHLEIMAGHNLLDPRLMHMVEERLEDRGNVRTDDQLDRKKKRLSTEAEEEKEAEEIAIRKKRESKNERD
ncbi:MAG: hypothetical protein ACTSXQ_06315 [Alphaproteobacteria bacterium]